MLDLFSASPSVGSWRCDPMTIAEIDAHPDADRIWATIRAMIDATDAKIDEAVAEETAGYEDAFEDAEAQVRAKAIRDCLDQIASIIEDFAVSDNLAAALMKVGTK